MVRHFHAAVTCSTLLTATVASSAWANDEREAACNVSNLTACRRCTELEHALDGQPPDAGEAFHGLMRNGLFAAFFLDCTSIGELVLKRGANASDGGAFGSMALTLSGAWPHYDKGINERWLTLLLEHGIRADTRTWLEDKSALQVVESGLFTPDYPDIWERIVDASR